MAEAESPRDVAIEIVAAVIIGAATVCGAYSAYQSALWGGNCLSAYNQGVASLSEANTSEMKGVQNSMFDSLTWMQYKLETRMAERDEDLMTDGKYGANYHQRMAVQIKKQIMDERIRRAMAWSDHVNAKLDARFASLPTDAEGYYTPEAMKIIETEYPKLLEEAKREATAKIYKSKTVEEEEEEEDLDFTTPKDSAEYQSSLFKNAEAHRMASSEKFAEGQKANQTGDRFTLMTVLFTISLFFGGLCATIKRFRIRMVFLMISVIVLVADAVVLIGLPRA